MSWSVATSQWRRQATGMHRLCGWSQMAAPRFESQQPSHPSEPSGTYADVLAGERPNVPAGFELPRRLLIELRPDLDAWQAATLVLEWAANNVSVDINDAGAQDAVSVLNRGRGRCSGLANANVALLLAAGFEARTVSGLLVGDERPIPHRWIECRLPGAGWVASDPTLGLWTVTPRHVVFADTVDDLPEVRVVTASKDGLERLPRHGGRLLRPNQGADLVCRPFGGLVPSRLRGGVTWRRRRGPARPV